MTERDERIKELKLRIAEKGRSQFGPSLTDVWELIEHFEEDRSRLHSALATARREANPMQFFHDAWGYAKERHEECSDGYDKKAFGHVQFWLEKLDAQRRALLSQSVEGNNA